MNGPSHYLESEQWIERAAGQYPGEARMEMLAAAQVHATLAVAAAQAMPTIARMMGDDQQITDWGHVTGWDTDRTAP